MSAFDERARSYPDPIEGNREGNIHLRGLTERLCFGARNGSAVLDDDEIRDRAVAAAKACDRLYSRACMRQDFDHAFAPVRNYVEREGVTWPAAVKDSDSPEQARTKHAGAVARARDPDWWRKQLRKLTGRLVETILREAGAVQKRTSPYVSDWGLKRWKASQRRNANLLENMDAIADDGTELPLIDCVQASVSNPINRRNELMVRMRGWEDTADAMGLTGAMLTLTCPSAYHPRHYASGAPNDRFRGYSPIDAMQYLNKVWARIRSAWKRADIKAFGFRICEPHHDGTPHFHFLLFFSPADIERAKEVFGAHAMAQDCDEPGAAEHRWDWKLIDKSKGSATGYIAKYVSKNIDGYGFGSDEFDDEGQIPVNEGALRVRAWASIWGIRQFQQIGSISVTVYRELRRRTEPLEDWEPEQVEALRQAADAGDWAKFVDLMGGAFIARDDQALRAMHVLQQKPGRYGDEIRKILGVVMRGAGRVVTRFKTWEIRPRWVTNQSAAALAVAVAEDSNPPPLEFCQ